MVVALEIRTELTAGERRALGRRQKDPRAALRMYAIAHALEGKRRAEAARLSGRERQALHDAVARYSAEGLAGLHHRPRGRRRPAPACARRGRGRGAQAARARWPRPRPPRPHGVDAALCGGGDRASLGQAAAPGQPVAGAEAAGALNAEKTRPRHPQADAEAQEAFKKGVSPRPWRRPIRPTLVSASSCGSRREPDRGTVRGTVPPAHARLGQKGRTTHRGWLRGQRPPGLCNKRFASAYLFAAVEPATGTEGALILPAVSAAAMSRFLAERSAQIAPDAHAVLVLDQAGWHGARALVVPDNITLVPRPPSSPELNPVERPWLYPRERSRSHRLFEDYNAVVDACCAASTGLAQEPRRIQSLTSYPWLPRLSS